MLITFPVGALTSATVLGATVAAIGRLAVPLSVTNNQRMLVIAAAAAVGVMTDSGLFGLNTPTLRRQTSSVWLHRYGFERVGLLWGLDLGLGFTTIRVSSLFWVVLVGCFVAAAPVTGSAIMACYAAGLVIGIVSVGGLAELQSQYPSLDLLRHQALARRSLIALMALVAIALAVATAIAHPLARIG
jgi:cytochrome c biogenesis protein CcdA